MGRYVPPEALDRGLSANQASGKGHPLGARASKLKTGGGLMVRFELPFAVWCTNCSPEQIIGQGVRFNAEKKKVGNYYSTPIWSFHFKHTICGEWLEVRTDPKNAEYVVVEGGRRRDYGVDKLREGEVELGRDKVTEEEKERIEKEGGFGALEKQVEDKKGFETGRKRVNELMKWSERGWSDPYELNKKLRREFRVGRRKRQKDEKTGEELKERYGIEVDMVAERDEDGVKAKLVDFGTAEEVTASSKPMFMNNDPGSERAATTERGKRGKKLMTKDALAQKKASLQSQLQANSRSGADPFLRDTNVWSSRSKRKRTDSAGKDAALKNDLVDYDSDDS